MKRLDDLSVFDEDYLPAIASDQEGKRDYYRRNNRGVQFFIFPGEPDRLLSATILYEMHSLGGTHYRRQGGVFFSLEYVRKGRLYVRLGERGYLLEAGDLCLMQPEKCNEYLVGRGDDCVKSSIAIYGELLAGFLEKSGLGQIDVLEKVDTLRLDELLGRFKELAERGGSESKQENSRLTYELLQFLCDPVPRLVASDQIRAVVEYMENNLDQPLPIALLAKVSGYSSAHLMRSFREIHGISPHRMLISLRMKRASWLLLNEPTLSVKQIAGRVGYVRPLNFSAEFRRRYGLSPQRYRRYYYEH